MLKSASTQSVSPMSCPNALKHLGARFASVWEKAGSSVTGAAALRVTRMKVARGSSIVFHMFCSLLGNPR